MDEYYKFFHARDAHYLLEVGSIRFGGFSEYRRMEEEIGIGIGDKEEGRYHIDMSGTYSGNDKNIDIDNFNQNRLVELHPTARNITIINYCHTNQMEAFCFCFAYGEHSELLNAMQDAAYYPDPYDASLRIPDLRRLTDAILSGTVSGHEGRPITDLFHLKLGKCEYRENRSTYAEQGIVPANPFVKRPLPVFCAQKEWRIVLHPRVPSFLSQKHVDIIIPNPAEVFIRLC